jgi:uncharacterized iron-regulated membrane protein
MKNAQLYVTVRKIHRFFSLAVLVAGICMMITGLCLYLNQYTFVDPMLVRYLHNKLSLLFSGILGAMMLTGLYLFLFPYLPNKREENVIKQ